MKKYDRQKGQEMFDEVYAKSLGQLPPAGVSEFTDYMLETLVGTLWADERPCRSGIAAFSCSEPWPPRATKPSLGIQIRSALARGELERWSSWSRSRRS